MRNSINLIVICVMMLIMLSRAENCGEWQLMGVYLEEDKVCYEGQGYVADRDVCASCSPELDYYWSPTEGCDCDGVPPQEYLWERDTANTDNISNINIGSVGIGITPTGDANLEVLSKIRVLSIDTNRYADFNHSGIAICDHTNQEFINLHEGTIELLSVNQTDTYINAGSINMGGTSVTDNDISSNEIKTNFLRPKTGTIVELSGKLRNTGVYGVLEIFHGGLQQTGVGLPLFQIINGELHTSGLIHTTDRINASLGIETYHVDAVEITASTIEASDSIKTRAINITDQDWSDYVFKPGYNLKPLDEVQSFITKNGHLPDIPSEQAVKKNGINVGEMQAKLLAKVEEMTLYMLQMQKRINELEAKLNELQ